MTDYTQTLRNYKNQFQNKLEAFLKLHEDAEVTEIQFIHKELSTWHEVAPALTSTMSMYQDHLFGGGMFPNRGKIVGAAISLGCDGKDIIIYNSVAIIKFLTERLALISPETPKLHHSESDPFDNYKNKLWFQVGLLFANGKMQVLLKKHNSNFTKIAHELGNKSYRPYISDSTGKSAKGDKNIFNNQSKLKKIRDYCLFNGITIDECFLKYIKPNHE